MVMPSSWQKQRWATFSQWCSTLRAKQAWTALELHVYYIISMLRATHVPGWAVRQAAQDARLYARPAYFASCTSHAQLTT